MDSVAPRPEVRRAVRDGAAAPLQELGRVRPPRNPSFTLAERRAVGEVAEGPRLAAVDVVIPGLGWVSVTGSGSCTVSVEAPRPTAVVTREPLVAVPIRETRKTLVKFTGSKLTNKRGKTMRRKGAAKTKAAAAATAPTAATAIRRRRAQPPPARVAASERSSTRSWRAGRT